MIGYLQRLIAGVREAPPGIRPVVQPLFLAPRFEPEPPGPLAEPPQSDSSSSNSSSPGPALPSAMQFHSAPLAPRLQNSRSEKTFEPLFTKIQPDDTGTSDPFPASDRELRELIEPAESGELPRWQKATPEPAEKIRQEAPSGYRVSIHPAGMPIVADRAPLRAPTAGGRGRRGSTRRAELALPEGDEVQIHIGRIEVIAVPPAPAPTVRGPARKSLDLDEYLKRNR